VIRNLLIGFATVLALAPISNSQAQALGDQWFIGVGGGMSRLTPKVEGDESVVSRDSEEGTVVNLIIGRDFDHLSSGQLQFFSLGEATFNDNRPVDYQGVEASLLYRFFDSRDNRRSRSVLGASFYGRFGVGYLERDSEVELSNDTPAYFGAGAGLEGYLTHNLGVRLEVQYFDTDASAASLSLIGRFGGYRTGLLSRIELPTRSNANAEKSTSNATQSADDVQTSPATNPQATVEATVTVPEPDSMPAETAADDELPAAEQLPAPQASVSDNSISGTVAQEPIQQLETAQVELLDPDSESYNSAQPQLAEPSSAAETLETLETAETAETAGTIETGETADNSASAASDETALPEVYVLPEVEIMANADESDDDTTAMIAPQSNPEPVSPAATAGDAQLASTDSDGDGIMDASDKCPESAPNFPVNVAGCGVFKGELAGLQFNRDNTQITSGTADTLDSFARLLTEYPGSRIEIVAHTDDSGSELEQAARTRTRLKTIGTYLVRQGATTDQLILRSFGAKRAKYSNQTDVGRRANNRVEIFESPR
jgi:outer membrane protein OmpA-like peptidoglycan-associated protein